MTIQGFEKDEWVCECSNTPADDGFYPCDRTGKEVEPTVSDWKTGLYVCAQCGRLIDSHTGEYKGVGTYISLEAQEK